MQRYRITTQAPGEDEQTWVLLPDRPSAVMQAEEFAQRHKRAHVRVYAEIAGQPRELTLDLPPK